MVPSKSDSEHRLDCLLYLNLGNFGGSHGDPGESHEDEPPLKKRSREGPSTSRSRGGNTSGIRARGRAGGRRARGTGRGKTGGRIVSSSTISTTGDVEVEY